MQDSYERYIYSQAIYRKLLTDFFLKYNFFAISCNLVSYYDFIAVNLRSGTFTVTNSSIFSSLRMTLVNALRSTISSLDKSLISVGYKWLSSVELMFQLV